MHSQNPETNDVVWPKNLLPKVLSWKNLTFGHVCSDNSGSALYECIQYSALSRRARCWIARECLIHWTLVPGGMPTALYRICCEALYTVDIFNLFALSVKKICKYCRYSGSRLLNSLFTNKKFICVLTLAYKQIFSQFKWFCAVQDSQLNSIKHPHTYIFLL